MHSAAARRNATYPTRGKDSRSSVGNEGSTAAGRCSGYHSFIVVVKALLELYDIQLAEQCDERHRSFLERGKEIARQVFCLPRRQEAVREAEPLSRREA